MSYNGYNYSHYFNSASQNTDRQGSHPSQSSNSINLNHPTSSYRQQQPDTRGYNASQPRQWNDQPNSSVPPASTQWYSGSNATSGGGYQGSTTATSASGPQSQYMGAAGRSGGSHLDTSALGSLAYASGLESSGVDSQPLQTNGRTSSDYNTTSRRIQTPPARLVSPMYGSTTTALANSNNHVRSGSTGSKQSQFVPSYRHAQQHLPAGHGPPQSANTTHSPHQARAGVSSPDPDAQSRHGSYTSSYPNAGANQSSYRMHNSELPTQQARSFVPERRTSSPGHNQQVHSSVQLENQRWQMSSAYGTQMSSAQPNNIPPSHHSPETTSRSVRSAASKHPQLNPAYGSTEATSKAVPQHVSQTNGTGQSGSSTHPPSSWEPSRTQDAPAQTERVRHHQLSQNQELRDSQPHPPQNLIDHDLQHPSMPAPSATPITVDPSRVFNPYHQEYQRRKALAEAEEARKDTRSSMSLHDRTSEQSQAPTRADPQVGSSILKSAGQADTPVTGRPDTGGGNVAAPGETAAKGANSGLESNEKEQMETEMKLMLEKMREYKAKDPSLFLQIWDQVKKGTTQTTMKTPTLPEGGLTRQASSQIPLPQPPSATDGSLAVAPTDNSQLPSPSPTIIQPPVAWELPVDSSPDLGKFPAMRRRRGVGRKSRLPRQSQTGPSEQSEKPLTSTQTSQAVAYEPQSLAAVDASSHGVQLDLQTGEQNELPDSSNTALQTSNLPAATRDDRQISRTLAGVRPFSPDRTFSTQAPSDTPQPAVARPTDVGKQSVKGTMQERGDSAAGIPTDQSSHNQRVGIVWPDSKKTALATAAERALTSTAVNAGKAISIGAIRTLLDSNPSYIELCESFEKLGFVFDRGHFARMLLAAVPDINSSTSAPSTMNTTSSNPAEMNSVSQDLSRAAISAPANSVNQAVPRSTTADPAGSAPRTSPKPSAKSGLSTMSPKIDVRQPPRSETLAQPITVPLHLMKCSPGRPRKDGSPAQPRKGGQIRQAAGNHVNSLVQNHAASAAVPTASRSLPIDPALLAADREDRQRLGSHSLHQSNLAENGGRSLGHVSDSHLHDHMQPASRSLNGHQQFPGSRETPYNVPHQDLDGLSTGQSVINGSASAEAIDRNAGPDIPGIVGEGASKQWLRDNLKWDPSRMWTKSSIQNRSGQEKPHNSKVTQVPPHRTANAKRDNASNLNANLPTQQYSSSSHLPKPTNLEHLSKREMARKRDFNDIVDLTQHLSGEEDSLDQPLQKRLKEDSFMPLNSAPEGSLSTPSWVVPPPGQLTSPGPTAGVDTPVTGGSMDISKFNLASAGPLSQKTALYMDVVKPLNKRHALRRSEYNAKTIARDVLIAAGRHPDMRPLNAHLDSLRRNFYAVEFGSDLATFNWQLVDPTPAGDHVTGLDGSIHDADDEDDGIAGFEQQTTFAIAQPPHRRAVMSRTDGGVEVLGDDIQIQRLGKGTLVKRRGPLHHSGSSHSARPAGHGHGGHANETAASSEVATPAERSSTQLANAGRESSSAVRVEVSARSSGEVTSSATLQYNTQRVHIASTSEKKPRGRPPKHGKSSSSTPSGSGQPSRAGSGRDDTDDDKGKKRRGRPPGSKNRSPQSSGSRAEGQFTVPTRPKSSANTTPARSALRNASTSIGDQPFAVIIDPTPCNTSPGRSDGQRKRKSESRDPSRRTRGRPSAASKAEPTYKVYECRWKDCKAELHNLETLRKHVRKVHRAKAAFGGIPCLWTGCGKVSFVQDRKTGRHNRVHQYLDFGTEDLWDQHMDKKHLEPFAWDLGDGPSAGPSDGPDTDLSDYLSDRKGRRMTPQAISSGPQDALILPAKNKPLRAYNKTHGNHTEMEKAQAIFKALEHRKQIVGPGIERGGCTLVTPARRAALRDSEFAVRVLDEDDESS